MIGNTYALLNLDQNLGSGSPATWYAALLTTLPTDGAGTSLVEANWTGYTRQSLTNNNTIFPAASVVANIAQKAVHLALDWGVVAGLGAPITVRGVALYSSSGGGNLGPWAVFGTIASPVTFSLANGSDMAIAIDNLVFQET